MQTPTPTPPPPPTPAPVLVDVSAGQATRPLTQAEAQVIRQQRSEMSDQLTSAQRRRDNLLDDIRNAPPGTEEGLKQQLQVLNERIVLIEKDIEESGRTLRTGQVPSGTVLVPPRQGFDTDTMERAAGITVSVIVPVLLGVIAMRWISRRRCGRADDRARAEQDARMERIEQAVDAIALEVERVGESQRYQAKLLAEANLMPALQASQRAAEPARLRELEELRGG